MAEIDDIKTALGCLSTVFPQFVAKEIATLTDEIVTGVQSFTDPLTAFGDMNVDALVDDVATLYEGAIYSNLAGAAAGLMGQYAKREATDLVASMSSENASVRNRVQAIRNLSSEIVSAVGTMMSLFPDVPYIAAQRMCSTIIDLADLKN